MPELGAIEGEGTELWHDASVIGTQAVADFDADGEPEVVRVAAGVIVLNDTDGTELWTAAVPTNGGGVPVVADLDGDGEPEIGVAGNAAYTAFEADGSEIWSVPITENGTSSGTGSSVFDFEGDGAYEIVYADEDTLWVFEGASGSVLLEVTGHASGTALEYPTIADIDGDGSAEILVGSNSFFSGSDWVGLTAIGSKSGSWGPARPVWNQYHYHVSNVEDDASIPVFENPNWLTWNNFRAADDASVPTHWLADLLPGEHTLCLLECDQDQVTVYVSVYNTGRAASEETTWTLETAAGAEEIRSGTLGVIASGEGTLLGPWTLLASDWGEALQLVIDPDDSVLECDEDDGVYALGEWPCAG